MRTLRRLRILTWCLLLPLLGTALPHGILWQCAHAAQYVTVIPTPHAMPCAMSGHMTMAKPMACCIGKKSSPRAVLQTPPCKPTLTPAASLSPARVTADAASVSPAPLEAAAFASASPSLLIAFLRPVLPLRGPPGAALFHFHRGSPVGLRAPPVA